MKVFIQTHGRGEIPFPEAEKANAIRIETSEGTFAIMEKPDGSLSISETTYNHLSVKPRASNAFDVVPYVPYNFSIEKEEKSS